MRKCREEDEKNSEEDPEWREYEDKNRRTSQSETNVGGSRRSREKQKINVEGCGLRPSPIGEQRRKLKNGTFQNLIPC